MLYRQCMPMCLFSIKGKDKTANEMVMIMSIIYGVTPRAAEPCSTASPMTGAEGRAIGAANC